jgi:hypothetical protein
MYIATLVLELKRSEMCRHGEFRRRRRSRSSENRNDKQVSNGKTCRRSQPSFVFAFRKQADEPMNHRIITRPFVPVTLPSVLTGDAAAQRDGQATWAASETAISIIDASH